MAKHGASGGISMLRLAQLRSMIAAGTSDGFYSWAEWEHTRSVVLGLDNNECQLCKAHGRYRRAALVHHVQHLKARPDLALSVFDPKTGQRQLVSVCRACHEEQHPERMKKAADRPAPVTAERWD